MYVRDESVDSLMASTSMRDSSSYARVRLRPHIEAGGLRVVRARVRLACRERIHQATWLEQELSKAVLERDTLASQLTAAQETLRAEQRHQLKEHRAAQETIASLRDALKAIDALDAESDMGIVSERAIQLAREALLSSGSPERQP